MEATSGYRELLRNRRWLLWETSATLSSVGYSVYAIAIPWFAYRYTASFLLVGVVLFVEVGIYALSFLTGPLVDRARDKRTIYLACYPAQAVAAALLGVAIGRGFLSIALLLGLVAFVSVLWDFTWTANNAVPRLLLRVDEFFRASGLGTLIGGAGQLAGYFAGAALVVAVGPSAGLLLYAGLLGAAALAMLPVSIVAERPAVDSYRTSFLNGWRMFQGKAGRALRQLATVELVRGFFAAAPAILIVAVAARTFSSEPNAYGVLFLAWAVGGIVFGLVLGEWNPRGRVGSLLAFSALASGLLLTATVAPRLSLDLGALVWFLFGATGAVYTTVFYVYLRAAYPPDAIGRVTSNLYLFTGVSGAAGAVVVGAIAVAWPLVWVGGLMAAGFLVAGALLLGFPATRRLLF